MGSPSNVPGGETPAPSLETPPSTVPGGSAMRNSATQTALLSVRVPAEAQVFVNGMPTSSTGSERRYVSNGLKPGFNYTYELRAQMQRDGRLVTETKVIRLQAGQSAEVAFGFNNDDAEERTAAKPVKTSLILHVPADAKVFLSGKESKSTGPVREFSTTRLAPGQSWSNYVVRVEMEVDGEKVTKEETVTLAAGESKDLSIGLDGPQMAQVSSEAGLQ